MADILSSLSVLKSNIRSLPTADPTFRPSLIKLSCDNVRSCAQAASQLANSLRHPQYAVDDDDLAGALDAYHMRQDDKRFGKAIIREISSCYDALEQALKSVPGEAEKLAQVQMEHQRFVRDEGWAFPKETRQGIMDRLTAELQKRDPGYRPPARNPIPAGLAYALPILCLLAMVFLSHSGLYSLLPYLMLLGTVAFLKIRTYRWAPPVFAGLAALACAVPALLQVLTRNPDAGRGIAVLDSAALVSIAVSVLACVLLLLFTLGKISPEVKNKAALAALAGGLLASAYRVLAPMAYGYRMSLISMLVSLLSVPVCCAAIIAAFDPPEGKSKTKSVL